MHTTSYPQMRTDGLLQKFYANVFLVMGGGLALTAIVARWIASDPALLHKLFHTFTHMKDGKLETSFQASGWWWAAAITELVLVFVMSRWLMTRRVDLTVGLFTFAFYAFLNGITLTPTLYAYTEASIAKVFFITAVTFGVCALWGYTTKRNLAGMGLFFFFGLIGLIVAMVVNAFLGSSAMDFAISVIGIIVFAGLTAYDMQKLREMYFDRGSDAALIIFGALTLYLDFVNKMLFFLRLFGVRKD